MNVLRQKVDVKDRHQNPNKLRPIRDEEEPEPEEEVEEKPKKKSKF